MDKWLFSILLLDIEYRIELNWLALLHILRWNFRNGRGKLNPAADFLQLDYYRVEKKFRKKENKTLLKSSINHANLIKPIWRRDTQT